MHKAFTLFTEIIGWIQIVASPLLIGAMIGAIIYFPDETHTNFIIACSIVFLGLIIGIIWATKIWKTKGTIAFLSNISASPNIEHLDEKKSNFEKEKVRSKISS